VNAQRAGRVAEVAVAAIAWALLVIGSAVMALTVPVYTSALTQALGVPRTAGLSYADVVRLSGQVRALVADSDYDPLPASWRGAPAFDAGAVSHLLDVRAVIALARLTTGILALVLATYVAFCVGKRRFAELAGGMRAGAVAAGAFVVLAALAATVDFESFFTAFHGLFFAAGTWTFPADSLLIRLFPERFWMAAGASWAGLIALGAGVLLVAAALVRRAATRLDASRTANNV
jgi:integral membrane protein (TIGR01906 family)